MKKLFIFMIALIFTTGCTNNEKAGKVIVKLNKNSISDKKIYISEVTLNKNETFFITNNQMFKVINDGVNKNKVDVGGGRFRFNIDYSLMRDYASQSEMKYSDNDLEYLKESIRENINLNKNGKVVGNKDEADILLTVNVEKCLIIDEGILSKKVLFEYNIEIRNKSDEVLYSSWPAVTFQNVKQPISNSINRVIIQEVCTILDKININTSDLEEVLPRQEGEMTKYPDFIKAMDNFIIVRTISKEEGRRRYEYRVPMEWERFFYYKK